MHESDYAYNESRSSHSSQLLPLFHSLLHIYEIVDQDNLSLHLDFIIGTISNFNIDYRINMTSSPDTSNPVYFWRPEGETGYLGQWWPSSFKWQNGEETYTYANAEQ